MTNREPTVAVILATYNRALMIGEAIDSLLNQTRPPDLLYVVDDGSTDNTSEIVSAYGDRIILIGQANAGRPAAFNRIIPQIETDYIWLFDDDDIALPHALATHLTFLTANPQYDFSYSPHYFFQQRIVTDGPGKNPVSESPDIPAERFFLWMMESHFAPTQMQGMLIPTTCYRTVGLFDEQLLRGQDRDMMLRIARRFRAGRIAEPTWGFRQHEGARGAGADSHDATDRYAVWRSYKQRIFRKLRDSLALSEYLPASTHPNPADAELDTVNACKALLQRAVIMSIHGLHDEATADFQTFQTRLSSSHSLTTEERLQISELSHIHNAESRLPARYFYRMGKSTQRDPELAKLMLRGLYWSIKRELQEREFHTAMHAATAAASLLAGVVCGDGRVNH